MLLLPFTIVKAQQDPQYTQYMYNLGVVNPAYAGSKDALSIGVLGRTQWVGVSGAPQTLTAFINAPVGKRIGLGLSVIADKTGPVSEKNAYLDFSYTLPISEEVKLALGLKAGFSFQDIGLLSLTQVKPNDPLFVENKNRTFPNFGLGAFFYTNKMYVGLSVPNLMETKHFEKSGGVITKASEEKHAFFTGGYVFDVSETLKFKPSFMTKFAFNAPISIDMSANFMYNQKVEAGLSYRWDDSVSAMVNLKASESFWIGYAYDHTVSNLALHNSGTHEITLLFDFSFNKNTVKSPRFF